MSYSAKVCNVMIASPSDVEAERAIVRDVVYEWNAMHSERQKLVLLPVGWETHSAPEMGQPPQAIINRQVLQRCDLLIAIFWTRLGTPTGEYASGTVEEIERHLAQGKPAMLYFCSRPAAMDAIDPQQVASLKEFKKECLTRGLCESYEGNAEFKEKLFRQLQKIVYDHPIFETAVDQVEPVIRASGTTIPDLSHEASVLLKAASNDTFGEVMYIETFDGTEIKTNDISIIDTHVRRELAKWDAALDQLVILGLFKKRRSKMVSYAITEAGYRIAEMIA